MAKKVYRICLIICLVLVIMAGLFYYKKTKEDKQPKSKDYLLVKDMVDKVEQVKDIAADKVEQVKEASADMMQGMERI